jgi:methenyltetrahydromethanopterin cyclohydrolase
MTAAAPLSVNARAAALVETMLADAAALRIAVAAGGRGEILIDAGAQATGSIAAGLTIAEICMGGLGTVTLGLGGASPRWPWSVTVRSSQPVIAALASQYAGWKLAHGEGKEAFFALGSGPARALARREPLFEQLAYRDTADCAVLVLESGKPPPPPVLEKVARDCGVSPERLTVIYAPTQSLAGSTQIVARALEVAMHKAHELGFAVERVMEGMATAPLAPPHPDLVTAMGRTNDAIIYAGQVHLLVSGPAAGAQALAEELPSSRSRDHGRPFAEIFKAVKRDFYAIDPMLFSPAEVSVTAIETGETFHAGRVDLDLLHASFA